MNILESQILTVIPHHVVQIPIHICSVQARWNSWSLFPVLCPLPSQQPCVQAALSLSCLQLVHRKSVFLQLPPHLLCTGVCTSVSFSCRALCCSRQVQSALVASAAPYLHLFHLVSASPTWLFRICMSVARLSSLPLISCPN